MGSVYVFCKVCGSEKEFCNGYVESKRAKLMDEDDIVYSQHWHFHLICMFSNFTIKIFHLTQQGHTGLKALACPTASMKSCYHPSWGLQSSHSLQHNH